MKKIILILIILLSLSLTSCTLIKKEFTCDDLTITLDSSFYETEQIGINMALLSQKYVVAITKNVNASYMSLEQFINEISKSFAVSLKFNKSVSDEGMEYYYATYNNKGGNDIEFSYCSAVFKYEGTFYIVDIGCETDRMTEKDSDKFIKWINSVVFE